MSLLRERLLGELRRAASRREVDEALARLVVVRDAGNAELREGESEGESGGEPLEGASVVKLGPDVYAHVPTRAARVALLKRAAAAAPVVSVHARIADDGTHRGRIAIDLPRRCLRALGVDVAEPGDRFGPDRYTRAFFDEEAFLEEVASADLEVTERHGFVFVLARAKGGPAERAEPFARELPRVAKLVRVVDAARRNSPEEALTAMRNIGADARARGPIGRARLRRAIGWVDALLPGAPSCYRRILLEASLDAGAARETVVFGLNVGSTGHVAFEGREESTFDVSFKIPAAP